MKSYICHSGGANGADFYFETLGNKFHVKTIAYSYKTKFHNSISKYELTDVEFLEGCNMVENANKTLMRFKYKHILKLLARNWFQVKNADEIFAIGEIKNRNSNSQFVKGGTGWAVQMAIDTNKSVFVYDQNQLQWFYWSYETLRFEVCNQDPEITKVNFAGIGTRKINLFGINAIENLYEKSFNKPKLNILYLHGLDSKLSIEKQSVLEEFGNVFAPDLNYSEDQNCINKIYEIYKNKTVDVIIGSSMGGFLGFYLSQLLNKPAFLFNPALKKRSVIQEIPNNELMYQTKITILLGGNDDVVPNQDTFSFLNDYKTSSQITILMNYQMAHGVPISVFENELTMYLKKI